MFSQNRIVEYKPIWELGKDSIEPGLIKGKIDVVDGTVMLGGTNSFSLPITLLEKQNDYTIEFEVKRGNGVIKSEDNISLISNHDEENKAGFGIKYFSPPYNAVWIYINGFSVIEQRGFLANLFLKYTILVKDKNMMLFRNGLLLAMTDKVNPRNQLITVGEAGGVRFTPIEMRNIRVYNSAQFPTGFDHSVERMTTFSGDQYAMQRVELKDKKLPRILIVGNSLSMGYRDFITEYYKGKAYVDYWLGGSWMDTNSVKGENSVVKRAWHGVLGNGPYDVVTWNAMTLHMWWPPQRWPEESLAPNMSEVTRFLKEIAPKTKLIWVRGTPFRENKSDGTVTLDNPRNNIIVKYNKIVDGVMKREGIPEDDLYQIAENQLHTVSKGSSDFVHWKPEVYHIMAQEIIKEIEKYIKGKENK